MTDSNVQISVDAAHRAAGYAMDRMSAALERGDYLTAAEEAEEAADLEFAALMATPRADKTERARIVKDIGSVVAYAGYLRSKTQAVEDRP